MPTEYDPNYKVDHLAPSYKGEKRLDYEAYCFYVPTGMGEDFEAALLKKLREFGKRTGKRIYVAEWDTGDRSYDILLQGLHCRAPAIVFSESANPSLETFNIVVEKLDVIKDLPTMITEIPQICQLIVNKDRSEAVKESVRMQRKEEFKRLINGISSTLKHISVTGSVGGVSVTANL